jgi:hypothetical protein
MVSQNRPSSSSRSCRWRQLQRRPMLSHRDEWIGGTRQSLSKSFSGTPTIREKLRPFLRLEGGVDMSSLIDIHGCGMMRDCAN